MSRLPRDTRLDSSLALLREGNTFISTRCDRYRSDIFQTRLLLQDTLCLRGEDAARLFYDQTHFTRVDAAPALLTKTLFGQGGVQGLDGEPHRVRKRMFMTLMTNESIDDLVRFTEEGWCDAMPTWQGAGDIVLFQAVQAIHFQAVCRWAGIPWNDEEGRRHCANMAAMIDGAGGIGKRHWQARRARKQAEAWAQGLVEQARAGTVAETDDRALFLISRQRDENARPLSSRIAAVELLNVLRPTVAIARYVSFAALALHKHPVWRERILKNDALIEPFVQEVRRFYTFFPFVAARVRHAFDWNGYRFPEGVRVLLDLFGTNHDPRSWERPQAFLPERFQGDGVNAYNFIPQGGGEHATNHRCPGEWFVVALMTLAVRAMTAGMTYRVPEQDLHVDWSRMPIKPASGFVISDVNLATSTWGRAIRS